MFGEGQLKNTCGYWDWSKHIGFVVCVINIGVIINVTKLIQSIAVILNHQNPYAKVVWYSPVVLVSILRSSKTLSMLI